MMMKARLLINFVVISFSLVLFFSFLWFRFIRERLPKNIPFELTTIGFVVIIFICVMYLTVIITTLFGKNMGTKVPDITLFLYKPLEYFTEMPIIQPYFSKYFLKFTTYLGKKNIKYLYIMFDLTPRSCLVIFFIIDVYYFKTIWFFYNILPIGLLIFVSRFVKYCIEFILQKNIHIIAERADLHCFNFRTEEDSSLVNAKDFVKEQVYRKVYNLPLVEYAIFFNITYVKNLRIRLNIPNNLGIDTEKFKKRIVSGLNLAIALYLIIYRYSQQQVKFKYLNLCILVLYFITWIYLLYVSFPSLDPTIFIELPKNTEEPFSSINL